MTTYPVIHVCKVLNGKPDWWKLTERCRVKCHFHPLGRFYIPAGYISDFATVPQWLWWLIPPHCKTANACIVHDYLYEHKNFTYSRLEADRFWYQLLKETEVPAWQRLTMYAYVRLLGWYTW